MNPMARIKYGRLYGANGGINLPQSYVQDSCGIVALEITAIRATISIRVSLKAFSKVLFYKKFDTSAVSIPSRIQSGLRYEPSLNYIFWSYTLGLCIKQSK